MQDAGFHMCGSIRICTTPERLEEAKYQMQRHGWQKSPQWIATTQEVAQIHPLLNVDDVFGALYSPGGYRVCSRRPCWWSETSQWFPLAKYILFLCKCVLLCGSSNVVAVNTLYKLCSWWVFVYIRCEGWHRFFVRLNVICRKLF